MRLAFDLRDLVDGRRPASPDGVSQVIALYRAVDERDYREMRGEPPDASGWVLFG